MSPSRPDELTLVILKPDALRAPPEIRVQILLRLVTLHLLPVIIDVRRPDRRVIEEHYVEHVGREHYPWLIEFFQSGPIIVAVFRGPKAVALVREALGHRTPEEAALGTIRRDFSAHVEDNPCSNLVHASASLGAAEREISLWFGPLGRHLLRNR